MFYVMSAIAELKARQDLLKAMPPEEAKRLKKQWKKEAEEELKHRRKLEIAEAGRARNFWGE